MAKSALGPWVHCLYLKAIFCYNYGKILKNKPNKVYTLDRAKDISTEAAGAVPSPPNATNGRKTRQTEVN